MKPGALDDATWEARHRAVLVLLVLQIAAVTAWTVAQGISGVHLAWHVAAMLGFGGIALQRRGGRRVRSCASALGLFTVSALVVHLSGGEVSAHFHYFVMLAVLALYEDMRPFALGVAYVVVQHAVLGSLTPHEVFGDPEIADRPVLWALVHGGFVLAASIGHFATWRAGARVRRRLAEAESRTQRYFHLAGSLFVVLDEDGLVLAVNRRACEVLGRAQDEIVGRDFVDLALPGAERRLARAMLSRLIAAHSDDPYPYEGPLLRADGQVRQVAWQVSRTTDGVIGSGHDVTERRLQEAELRRDQADLAALRTMAVAVAAGPDARQEVVEETAVLLEAHRVALVEPDAGVTAHCGPAADELRAAAGAVEHVTEEDGRRLHQPVLLDGRPLAVLVVEWEDGGIDLRRRTLTGMAANKLALALDRRDVVRRLEQVARTDALTGIANRRAFDEALPAALARAGRSGARVALALLDLNGLKQINDRHGHEAGDRLLRHAAAAWSAQLRAGDLLARIGGDEFAALLPGCADADEAEGVAQRLRGALDPPAGAGIGVVLWDGRESSDALRRRADRALYADKPFRPR